jgi:hypothetical protein
LPEECEDLSDTCNLNIDNSDQSFLNYEGDQSFLDDRQSFYDQSFEEQEPEMNVEYPNEAYADLMTLVIKHKLSNSVGNAIIKFFNKHSNLSKSPLPQSIKEGHKFMDNMNLPNFKYDKTSVIIYNDNEYYLYHRSLINCIKDILSISDISQNFALTSKNLKVRKEIYVHIVYTYHIYFVYINT